MQIRNILAAVDLGGDTERILAYSVWLARHFTPASIHLLHVIEYSATPPAYIIPYIQQEKERDEAELAGLSGMIGRHGVPSGHTIAVGHLIESFTTAIRDLASDMLVTGFWSHMVRPSSSERLIKNLTVPLFVVRGEKSESALVGGVSPRRVLCAIDFSENALRALEFAKSLIRCGGADPAAPRELTVLHVVGTQDIEKSLRGWQDISDDRRKGYGRDLAQGAERQVADLLQGCPFAEGIVRSGVAHKVIGELCRERDTDLIVMGARGLSYIGGILLGSVSEAVLKSSPCPVVIVR
ncbi:MAG TPA: universal stress protein [Dissulfurispiraceae bacterium]|nr:universal stress protein [Dissulfurispiraceae bacterium]